ncbi:MAG: magnesium transporter, partial [Vicingaceae bacterium]
MQFELTKEYLEQLNTAVESSSEDKILQLIDGLHAVDVAEILDEQSTKEAKAFYDCLPNEMA